MGTFIKTAIWLLSLNISPSQASVIKFEAYPSVIKANLTSAASMRCSLADTEITNGQIGKRAEVTNTDDDVLHISSIVINRINGEEVASVTPFDAPTSVVDFGNLEVKGDVSGTSSEGFLQLTWRDTSAMVLGEYMCEISTIEAGHHTVIFTSSLEVTQESPSMVDIITELNSIKHNQDLQNLELKQQLNYEHAKGQSQQQEISDLKLQLSNVTSILQNQQQECHNLSKELKSEQSRIEKLSKCTAPGVAFMAVFTKFVGMHASIPRDHTVIFDKMVTHTDGGYNSKTGLFICGEPGVYAFHVNIVSYGKNDSCLHLWVNSDIATSMYARDDGTDSYLDSGSMNALLALKPADVVKVATAHCGDGADFYQNNNLWHSVSFTGHLVRSDDCGV